MKALMFILSSLVMGSMAYAWNEPTGFRDIPWGSTEQVLEAKLKAAIVCRNRSHDALPERVCEGHTTIGPVPVTGGFWFRSGRFVGVSLRFYPKDFFVIEESFVQRYGSPTSVNVEPIKTREGQQETNRTVEWIGSNARIYLQKYGSVDAGSLADIATMAEHEERVKRKLQEIEQGAKDL
jgi:hypothetical protein